MRIYIKGMEMPTDCIFCHMFSGAWTMCNALNKTTHVKGRPNDCPLVEVPTPHGRLIDADLFEKGIKMWTDHPNDYIRQRNQDMLYYVQTEKTVIEAEDGK